MADNGGEAVAQAAIAQALGLARTAGAPARVMPTLARSYMSPDGRLCRVYEHPVRIDGEMARASALVCRHTDGQWALSAAETGTLREAAERGFACPAPGTVIETSVGGWFRFTEGDGFRCWYQTRNGNEDSRYADLLGGDSSWIEKGSAALKKLWPLRPGKRTWFVVDGVSGGGYPTSWYETYTVRGRERVTVPAGTFDTYVITWQEQGRMGNDYEAEHTFWYAPSVGYFVKFEAARALGSTLEDWEATRIRQPRGNAPITAGIEENGLSGSSRAATSRSGPRRQAPR